MTLVHARALLSIEEILFSLSSSSWNLKLSNLYAGKRGRLDLDLLNSPIWQVNRNRVKSVATGPQQSPFPHERLTTPPGSTLRFWKSSVRPLRCLPVVKEGWMSQDQWFNVTVQWRDHHLALNHSQYNLLPLPTPPPRNTHTHILYSCTCRPALIQLS